MKRAALLLSVFTLGFVVKVGLAEAERLVSHHYIDGCLERRKSERVALKTECYTAYRHQVPYRMISFLNTQPELWKNTKGRCLGTGNAQSDCRWWNRFSI